METKYLIFTNPRSGSSVLGQILWNYLQKKKNYGDHLGEYLSTSSTPRCFKLQEGKIVRSQGITNTSIRDRLRFLRECDQNYNFELHSWQTTPDIFNFLNGDYHFICLHRRNLLESLLSNAIGNHFKIWDTWKWESKRFIPKLKNLQPNDLILKQDLRYHGYMDNVIQYYQYWLPKVINKSTIYYEDFCNLKDQAKAMNLIGFSDWEIANRELHSIKIPYPYPKIKYFRNKDEIKGWVRELEKELNWPWPFKE